MTATAHQCYFYENNEDLFECCLSLVESASQEGLQCLYIYDEYKAGDQLTKIVQERGSGFRALEAGCLNLRDTPLSIATVVERLNQIVSEAEASSAEGVLLLLDMSWLLHTPSCIAHHGEFGAALEDLVAEISLKVVCLYCKPLFPPSMLIAAIRSHPYVASNSNSFWNPHFVPPRILRTGTLADQFECLLGSVDSSLALPIKGRSNSEDTKKCPRDKGSSNNSNIKIVAGAILGMTNGVSIERRWKIRCFGSLRIYRQDGSLIKWNEVGGATVKVKTLFAFLLRKGKQGALAEEIADLLWPDAESTSKALNRLYHTVHCLRLALSPELKSSQDSKYILNHDRRYFLVLPEDTWIDIPVFQEFCRQGEKLLNDGEFEKSLACHHSAEQLYTGNIFEDIPNSYMDNSDLDWCWSYRYWLKEIYVKMLTYMADIYIGRTEFEEAIKYGNAALKFDPCFEPAHQELMRTYSLVKRYDALERQYRMCVGVLNQFEDRNPSEETISLYRALAV